MEMRDPSIRKGLSAGAASHIYFTKSVPILGAGRNSGTELALCFHVDIALIGALMAASQLLDAREEEKYVSNSPQN